MVAEARYVHARCFTCLDQGRPFWDGDALAVHGDVDGICRWCSSTERGCRLLQLPPSRRSLTFKILYQLHRIGRAQAVPEHRETELA